MRAWGGQFCNTLTAEYIPHLILELTYFTLKLSLHLDEKTFFTCFQTLFLSYLCTGGKKQESCAVILEPLAMSQRQLQYPVSIFLKGSLMGWSLAQAGHFLTESWMLQSSQGEHGECNRSLFHQLLRSLVAEGLHMVNLPLCLKLISALKSAVTKGVAVSCCEDNNSNKSCTANCSFEAKLRKFSLRSCNYNLLVKYLCSLGLCVSR